jgi:hypothetical protein
VVDFLFTLPVKNSICPFWIFKPYGASPVLFHATMYRLFQNPGLELHLPISQRRYTEAETSFLSRLGSFGTDTYSERTQTDNW